MNRYPLAVSKPASHHRSCIHTGWRVLHRFAVVVVVVALRLAEWMWRPEELRCWSAEQRLHSGSEPKLSRSLESMSLYALPRRLVLIRSRERARAER